MSDDLISKTESYRVLGLEPWASPRVVRQRYQALIEDCKPDRFPEGSAEQADALRRTNELNEAFREIRRAAMVQGAHVNQSSAITKSSTVSETAAEKYSWADRLFAAIVCLILCIVLDVMISSDYAVVWIAIPLLGALGGAIFGPRAVEGLFKVFRWVD